MVYNEAKSFIGICYSQSRTALILTDGHHDAKSFIGIYYKGLAELP